jgi:hypothetical protein
MRLLAGLEFQRRKIGVETDFEIFMLIGLEHSRRRATVDAVQS